MSSPGWALDVGPFRLTVRPSWPHYPGPWTWIFHRPDTGTMHTGYAPSLDLARRAVIQRAVDYGIQIPPA